MSTANTTPEVSDRPATPGADQPEVRFEHVSIGFDGHSVLTDINFSANTGEMIIILGPSGGGKSILLKLTNGLLRPDSGSIWVFGEEISSMPERDLYAFRSNIGMVFQESALFDSRSVRDNVAFRLREQNDDEEDVDRRVRQSLRFVELEDAIDKFPAELSGGMKRRVAIARAVIGRPSLVIADEPTSSLDMDRRDRFLELLFEVCDYSC